MVEGSVASQKVSFPTDGQLPWLVMLGETGLLQQHGRSYLELR